MKEPLNVFFSSMIAFGNSKKENKLNLLEQYEHSQIQSQSEIISNLSIYHKEIKNQTLAAESVDVGEDDLLSDVKQEESHGLIADISNAIRKNEYDDQGQPKQNKVSCILQRSTFEFEKSDKLQKIKAIRGLTPNKDLKIELSDTLKALLVTKTTIDARFKSMHSSIVIKNDKQFKFIRIKNAEIFEGKSPQFRKIYIIQTLEDNTSFIIFLPL